MKKLNLYKRIILGVFIISSLTNCSKDAVDEWNDSVSGINKNSRITLKTESGNYQEEFIYNSTTKLDEHSITWIKTKNYDGTFNYSINGNLSDLPYGLNKKGISFNLGNNVQVGKIITVDVPDFNFVLSGDIFNPDIQFVSGITTGQVKITHFDGVTMSGEFNFGSLVMYSNYSGTTKNHTAVGTFTLIEMGI